MAFSDDENVLTHICKPTPRGTWLCDDRRPRGEPTAPSGLLVQDGIRVAAPSIQAPSPTWTPRLEVQQVEAIYDHEVRIDARGRWFEERLMVERDQFQLFDLQYARRGANLNASMAVFEELVREEVGFSSVRDDQPEDVVVVVDQLADPRMVASISGWLLELVDADRVGLAVERGRRTLLVGC